jgi:hypothetical protein
MACSLSQKHVKRKNILPKGMRNPSDKHEQNIKIKIIKINKEHCFEQTVIHKISETSDKEAKL